jgi:hypothetical protein
MGALHSARVETGRAVSGQLREAGGRPARSVFVGTPDIVNAVDVYVIPIGRDRYELYCESATDAEAEPQDADGGFFARLRHRFSVMLREAEARRHDPAPASAVEASWATKVRQRVMVWVAERIAEQRLLWSLRRETEVVAAHPVDLTFDQVRAVITRILQRDRDRHLRWLIIDSLLALASAALAILPGPNFVFYYFAFRLVGHWFSMQGANQGMKHIAWVGRPCPPLSELRDVGVLHGSARSQRIDDISERLRLKNLSTFYERVAV